MELPLGFGDGVVRATHVHDFKMGCASKYRMSVGPHNRGGVEKNVGDRLLTETVEQSLWTASRFLLKAPRVALEQACETERRSPGHVGNMLLTARAYRACGEPDQAEQMIRRVLSRVPNHGAALRELALVYLMRKDVGGATGFLEGAIAANGNDAAAWSVLADIRRFSGDTESAEAATRTSLSVAVRDEECLAAAFALTDDRLPDAEHLLRLRLHDFPSEVSTIRMMAELATRLGRFVDAERLLRRALEIAPYFHEARELLARNLQRANRPLDALAEVELLIVIAPSDPSIAMLQGSLLVRIGEQERARVVYEKVLAHHPGQAKSWMSLGHVLKALGKQEEAISAYRRAIGEVPHLGEAWWSLANLKTVRFAPADVVSMERALPECNEDEDKFHLHFALGKAMEDSGAYEAAFTHWIRGNSLRRKSLPYDAEEITQCVGRAQRFFDATVLSSKAGHPAADPIFIVGMPRSGSTLIEQILASHSQIEGTMELPDMMEIATRLSTKAERTGQSYPDMLAIMTDKDLHNLGEEYLERTRVHRKTGRPYFIDKMPNNWTHVGLIRMIFPNAHIIDARRHPVGCCLSVWKQHFARGQAFSYDLKDVARYYRDYVTLMAHFELVVPGLVHRVVYEQMVADSAAEVRKLLDYLGLPFEDSCLAFWRNDRAVRTASSEQVRQPIFTGAVNHWRHFEPWLGPLLTELEPVLKAYAS